MEIATRYDLINKIEQISGENLYKCVQCGRCASSCPFTAHMDYLPNKLIRLIMLGAMDRVDESITPLICASCFSCEANCPMGVDLSKVMEAIRELTLRQGQDLFNIDQIKKSDLRKMPQILLVSNFRKTTA